MTRDVSLSLPQPGPTLPDAVPPPAEGGYCPPAPAGTQAVAPPVAQPPPPADPDAKEWVYLDDENQQQGPFSLAEMRDWFEKGFFEPTLQVKRQTYDSHASSICSRCPSSRSL